MSRFDYMNELKSQLQEIPPKKRAIPLKYYEEYFDKAGPENEEKVIADLGPPTKLAMIIKAKLRNSVVDGDEDLKAKKVVQDTLSEEDNLTEGYENESKGTRGFLIALFALPIGIPLLCVFFVAVTGMVMILSGFILGVSVVALGTTLSGIICLVKGIANLMTAAKVGVLGIGMGFLLFGIGVFMTSFTLWLCLNVFPTLISSVLQLVRRPFVGESEV